MGGGERSADGAASLRGQWSYRVGLVGKPSVGKSSLFNALTHATVADSGARAAKVGAAPFTTIDPNLGAGWWAAPAASEPVSLVEARSACEHGRAADGRRLLPVALLDIAGLVPGAYLGRGRGNQFLGDLTTCDALIHVTDAAGFTDAGGNPTLAAFEAAGAAEGDGDGDGVDNGPSAEIEWVHAEVHRWVFSNVLRKRPTWKRRPAKLKGMFGYGNSPALVDGVLRRCRAASAEAAGGRQWAPTVDDVAAVALAAAHDEVELHRLVAHFVAARWPIAIALNSATAVGREEHRGVPRGASRPHDGPVLAAAELALLEARAAGTVDYRLGAGRRSPTAPTPRLPTRCASSSGGARRARSRPSAAVALRPPTLAFPVAARHARAARRAADAPPLRDCLQMKPLSTAGDVYEAAKKAGLCSGDFVRAEAIRAAEWVAGAAPNFPVKRDDALASAAEAVRVQTTRRSQWQHRA